ncbi:MAG: nucleotidyltransferase family protein [Candidatus Aminicenantes bacterium]|nr:nucleotidyltransferase family protein [Candidatus Aminicenantes bacterium]
MEQSELLGHLVRCLETLNIPYFVTGAVASIAYGEPRLTNDIDVVAQINERQIDKLKACFPEEEFYLDSDSIREAIRRRHQFNIIHPASGLKIDVMISKEDAFDKSRFARIKRMRPLEDTEANFSSPEDVIIKKMEYYKEGASEKHIRDIMGMIKISGDLVDFEYIALWAKQLNLEDIWLAIQEKLSS